MWMEPRVPEEMLWTLELIIDYQVHCENIIAEVLVLEKNPTILGYM